METRDLTLPSGKTLHIQPAEFEIAKELYQVFAEEMLPLKIDSQTDVNVGLMKNIACILLSSKKLESKLWPCFKTVTIDGLKIDKDTFQPIEARMDWLTVCLEVARDNILPFMKHLMPLFSLIVEKAKDSLASELKKTATS